jgi:Fuc2NAc and GlcNAc transferase
MSGEWLALAGRPLAVTFLVVLALALLATGRVLRRLRERAILDRPNERSSHAIPTPRGGGIGILAALLPAWMAIVVLGYSDSAPLAAIACALVLALVSWRDDVGGLSPTLRFAVQALAVAIGIAALPGAGTVFQHLLPPWLDRLAAGLLWLWFVNLFNFMDGIDGIAASEAIFVSLSAAGMIFVLNGDVGLVGSFGALGMASMGFLVWNWPPARIFMGDVGSGFLGFMLAALALLASRRNVIALQVWPILGGVFLVDATVTLIRRMVRGDRWYEAHRMHAYQHLARVWGGHSAVTLAVCAVNLCWLLPWAWYASAHPSAATLCVAVALLPLVVVAIWAGAGTP